MRRDEIMRDESFSARPFSHSSPLALLLPGGKAQTDPGQSYPFPPMSLRPKFRVPSPRQPQPHEFRRIAAAGTRGWGPPFRYPSTQVGSPSGCPTAASAAHTWRGERVSETHTQRVRVRVKCPLRHAPGKRTACFGLSPPGEQLTIITSFPSNQHSASLRLWLFNLSLWHSAPNSHPRPHTLMHSAPNITFIRSWGPVSTGTRPFVRHKAQARAAQAIPSVHICVHAHAYA
ncbi:hypothetical protein BDP55DRAFT_85017 [Colletotrichum godetiae]|uniref:Uncharacterized protein n=1 Tax=Colletotrichum godetiae TaxID=1209918 RepID=A0AAJ0AP00_9PEZI|nr:uncharacterized protein BDP55DRAFT_85017 [Colletotrichum godetiae]KAK1687727.1 hypothetical protein BDP55DRAFT_85017 [Colletotrichum godetiae]